MVDRIYIGPQPPPPVESGNRSGAGQTTKTAKSSFAELLDTRLNNKGGVAFSRHAASRMESRGITFSPGELKRLNRAVEMAQAKGARDSLVLLEATALVVSIKNNTVITVADKADLKDNVFTRIDSAVIA